MPGKPHSNGTGNAEGRPDALALALAEATVAAVESTGGFAGGVYLRSGTPGLLRLAALAGLPALLFHPWWRMHINRPFPVADAHRSGKPVHLADAEDAMRRYPQLMAGLPFPFGSLYEPVAPGRDGFGVLVVLRAATPGRPVDPGDRRRMHQAARHLGTRLADLAAGGTPVAWDDPPVNVQLPTRTAPPVRTGHLDWDTATGAVTTDEELRTILGTAPDAGPPATIDAVTALLAPEDAYGLWTVARRLTDADHPHTRRIWLRARDGRPCLLELSPHEPPGDPSHRPPAPGRSPPPTAPNTPSPADRPAAEPAGPAGAENRVPGGPGGGSADGRPRQEPPGVGPSGHARAERSAEERPPPATGGSPVPDGPVGHASAGPGAGRRLRGVLVDPGAGAVRGAAADRLAGGICSLDRLGRITFVSSGAETLLGRGRPQLIGRVLWEALPWFGRPAYEDNFRAALLSDEPVHFLAHRDPESWLSVSLYPGHEGLTMTFAAAEQPAYTPGSVASPGAGLGSPADRASMPYRPVALAIALTEAVTARQVSAVVTEELLPAFGGRQLAIYLLSERHLHLAWETGFPQGFLDRFDGVGLDARLPGVETLTTGRPIFFESMQRLAAAYPGIPMDAHVGARAFLPLIASGRPVGSCILGFDQPRGFSPEERTVLTALAGLIAQALERARRYDSEAALARGLQDALLPHTLPRLHDVDTAGRYLPGTQGMEVGGDWYDVIDTGRGIALIIGDVQGHGVAAAATMGQLRSAVRAFALSGHDPEEVMSGTNRLLIDLDAGQFATCCYIVLDAATGLTRAVRAGHLQPLLRHPDGTTEVLDLPGGVVLGVDPEAAYPVTELRLAPGDVLALFTDGLVERPGTDIDLGIERLRGALSGVGASPLAATAERLIREATGAHDRPDDIALLLAARRPDGDPRRSSAA
ncbi:diguanylate cyclase [Streptomyces sp. CB03234]|uniref:SpoIIE family protein phosphatase n=1 Tax=Streptomyces sp. (strain CB03234) TaxID=1703937 RepID=UPI0009629DCE|nr:SpoIIE family protein phosphatase [Streptomyces sp. CB03234]OKK03563.1 diguanylate cyclase [Streptomyces sp. CB03234]